MSGPWPTGPGSDRVVFLPPFLRADDRWFTFESDPAPAGEPTFVWASTIPIVESDLTYGAIIPPATIEALPPEGAVITIGAVTEVDPSGDPFPYPDLSLDLDRGMLRPPVAEEPGADDPDTRLRVIELSEGPVLVRVYFGTASPSEALIESAQRELDTLQLAPACPVPAEGPYGASLMADQGAPGDVLIVLGMNTFRREDGSYDTASVGSIVAWWNADPTDWPYLASFSTVTPSPAVAESPLIRLGADGVDTCGFAIDAVVPDVPPGDYPVVVISEGHGGASIRSVLTFHVVD